MKYVLNSVTSVQPDNLKAGSSLLKVGGIDNYHRSVDFSQLPPNKLGGLFREE